MYSLLEAFVQIGLVCIFLRRERNVSFFPICLLYMWSNLLIRDEACGEEVGGRTTVPLCMVWGYMMPERFCRTLGSGTAFVGGLREDGSDEPNCLETI